MVDMDGTSPISSPCNIFPILVVWYDVWCSINLVEHQEESRRDIVQSILAYVGLAAFLTYRDTDGFVRYAMWFEDKHLGYVLGLHAAHPGLGGVEVRPSDTPSVLEGCDHIWDMEMSGYGAGPLPQDTGRRSATAALGTQITDIAYRLLICQRVSHSDIISEYVRSGGRPVSIYRKAAGIAVRESLEFMGSQPKKPAKKDIQIKPAPYTHTRIILGANSVDHLGILRDSFPAGSLRRRGILRPDTIPALVSEPPSIPHTGAVHFPVFNDDELHILEIIPTTTTEVPMEYGRGITTTTQPPIMFGDVINWEDSSTPPQYGAVFLPDDTAKGMVAKGMVAEPLLQPAFPIRIMSGDVSYPIRIIPEIRYDMV